MRSGDVAVEAQAAIKVRNGNPKVMQPSEVRTTATALRDAAICHFHGGLTLVPSESIAQAAGARLRAELDAALRLASQGLRREMEFDESARSASTRPLPPPTKPRR